MVSDWSTKVGLSYVTGTTWFDGRVWVLTGTRRGTTVFLSSSSTDVSLLSNAASSLRDKCCTIAQPIESPNTLIAVRNRSLKIVVHTDVDSNNKNLLTYSNQSTA